MNSLIIQQFEKLVEKIKLDINTGDRLQNSFRLRQISNVLKILRNYPTEIKSGEQLAGTPGVGEGSIRRINEILTTGSLAELGVTGLSASDQKAVNELEKIHGVGPKLAYDLVVNKKIKSIEQLKKSPPNETVKLGLKYYGVYKQSIPRSTMAEIDEYIHNLLLSVSPELVAVICGSYRRLKMTSNDIDLLLVHPQTHKKWFHDSIKKLTSAGFIIDSLTPDYDTKFMGFCKYKDVIYRLDIRFMPWNAWGTALLYFTGSGEFNQQMRLLAIGLGYKLNEYGLYKDGVLVPTSSEKDVFDILGLEYVPPENR